MSAAKAKSKPRTRKPAATEFDLGTPAELVPPAGAPTLERHPDPTEDCETTRSTFDRDNDALKELEIVSSLVEEITRQVEDARAEYQECKRRLGEQTARLLRVVKRLTAD